MLSNSEHMLINNSTNKNSQYNNNLKKAIKLGSVVVNIQ